MYPVMLDVRDRPCLVVGGGAVASRKVRGLLDAGARVTVVALDPVAELQRMARERSVTIVTRGYRSSDLEGMVLAFAATDDRGVNRQVWEDARRRGIWVNVADDPEFCTFHLPARVVRGRFQVAIASDGDAPFLVRRVREAFERRIGPAWAEWVEAGKRLRERVRILAPEERESRFDAFFARTFDPHTWSVRVPGEVELEGLAGLSPGDGSKGSPEPIRETGPVSDEADRGGPGLVSLVGAGPGDPGLLTVKGRRRLEQADVIVYDRLAEPALPADLPRDVPLVRVGKEAGHHPVPQDRINELLVSLARKHGLVVRLKGGDPFVFGRGGEEVEALVAAGVPFEIVPAPTAGVAAAAYAGIPVTQRGDAVRLTLLTAHESVKGHTQVRWDLLARDPHATLVGYMGVGNLRDVVARLLTHGMPPDTEAAMIERGTTAVQRTVRARLEALPDAVTEAGIRPPALFVIGSTVRYMEQMAWFERRPLHGQRLLVGRAAESIQAPLERAGAAVVPVRFPVGEAARVAVNALPVSGVVVESVEELTGFHELLAGNGRRERVMAWCMTRASWEQAQTQTWQEVVRLPESPHLAGQAIVDRLLDRSD